LILWSFNEDLELALTSTSRKLLSKKAAGIGTAARQNCHDVPFVCG